MNILSISHNDLDGFGCQFCIYEKFKNYNIKYENTGYNSIEETLNRFNFNKFDLVFITDLNFNENQQKLLYNKLQNYKGKCIYIDHHQYTTTDWLNKCNAKIIIDDKSATLKTYEILKLDNSNLFKLCELIDIFDTWKKDNPKFKGANLLNDYFWENIDKFRDTIISLDYDIKPLKPELLEMKQKVKEYFTKNLNKIIYYNNKILISFEYKYINHIEEIFPDLKFAIIVNKDINRISIRDFIGIKENIVRIVEQFGGSCGGHINAYGMVIPNLSTNYQEVVKKLVEEASKFI